MIISFTKSNMPYGWLGNMTSSFNGKQLTIMYNNKVWPTSENLFQALRFKDDGIRNLIRLESGYNSKKVAKRFATDMTVDPLSKEDVLNMIKCVALKIKQHDDIRLELEKTKGSILIEDVSFRMEGSSLFWGAAKIKQHWIGLNCLGKIWMHLRDNDWKNIDNVKFINDLFKQIYTI